jgi:hypothetical protein
VRGLLADGQTVARGAALRPRSVAIAVEGYIGLPGSGKTYALASRGIEFVKAGYRVFSNFELEGTRPILGWDCENVGNTRDPGPPCECGRCFVSLSHAVVLVDEINLWAPSRMWNALPLALLHRWAQVRKFETHILWSAQHEARVDKAIRELTGYIWECSMLPGARALHWIPGWPTFRLRAFEPADMRKQGSKPIYKQNLKLRKRVALAYDTFQVVDVGSQFAGMKALARPKADTPAVAAHAVGELGYSEDGLADPWGLPTDDQRREALDRVRYGSGGLGGGESGP